MDFRLNLPNMNIQVLSISAHFNHVKGAWYYPKHHHHTFEFLYMLDGNGEMKVLDHAYPLHSGEGLLIRPNEVHDFTVSAGGECQYFTFHFDVDDMQLRHIFCLGKDGFIGREEPYSEQLRSHLNTIDRIMNQYVGQHREEGTPQQLDLDKKLLIQAEILYVLRELSEAMMMKRKEGIHRKSKNVTYRKAELADAMMQYMNDRLHSTVQIQDVAKHFNVSLSYCNQLFTSVYGLSPRAYLSNKKLAEIKRYLLESKLTVEQISDLLGFASPAHFSRQFKRWTGMPPQLYRKSNTYIITS